MTSTSVPEVVLAVEGLTTEFPSEQGRMKAVDGVSLRLHKREILALIGESGSGKSVTGFSILGLIDWPGSVVGGSIMLHGKDLRKGSEEDRRRIRGDRIAMVFQDPMSSLHPMLTVGRQMNDAIFAHRKMSKAAAKEISLRALARVGIPAPAERLRAFPHELSGGMRQRVSIAIALLNSPDVIIADEPTTGLDVTIQAQILFEMQKLVSETGSALIWITHDLSVVAGLADRVAVMYAGRIVEEGPIDLVIEKPGHPYTAGLLASVPSRNRDQKYLPQIPGSIGGAHHIEGCRFAPRCRYAIDACTQRPEMTEVGPNHSAACFLAGQFENKEGPHD